MNVRFDPLESLRSFWRYRDLIWQMTERDARARYRSSAGGLLWSAFYPLLMLGVYTLFFTELFPSRWVAHDGGRGDFALTVFIGMLLHGLLSESIIRAPSLVVGNPSLVKKVVFPLEVLPIVALGSTLFHLAIGFGIWLAFYLFAHGLPPATSLWLPVIVLPLALLTLGFGWVLSSLGVYLRDVVHVVPAVSTVLLFASPVFYPIDALREPLRSIVAASPLTIPIEQARNVLLWGRAPDPMSLLWYSAVAIAVAYVGLAWFQGTRKGFADVL